MKLSEEILSQIIHPRQTKSHKGDYGKVLIIGGAPQFSGAIIMAATACITSGAGLVTVATSKETRTPLLTRLPEAMVIDWQNQKKLTHSIAQTDVVLIGCGLAEDEAALAILKSCLKTITKQTLIIDASAINLIAKNRELLKLLPANTILTPHQKELERLSQIKINDQTIQNIQLFSDTTNTIIVAKSEKTTIFCPKKLSHYIDNGTPAMATGGMGDTLAGMIAGMIAQFKQNIFKTVCCATFLHSQIAKELSKDNYVVLPTKVAQSIPKYMAKYALK